MSYILDALRKADAERERGRIPGIHAQQLTAASADADTEAADRSKPLLWVIIGLLVALVVALAWNMLGRDGAALTPTAATRLPADAASATPAASAAALQPVPAIAATATATAASAAAAASTASVTAHAAHKRAVRKPAVARTAPAKEPAPAPAQRVYALNELPADIRQQLPALVVGGASYSTNPTSRMLILNGQVFHEGDRLTPDLVLQQIKLKAAVLEFKGYRYEIKY